MGNWNDYKKTFRTEPDLFDFARQGDFRGLVEALSQNPGMDLDTRNARGYSALMLAVYNGEKDCCEALLRCGADVNSTDLMGNTVLMASAFKGDLETVQLLLRFGADAALENRTGMSAQDWAQMFGRNEITEYLDVRTPCRTSASRVRNILRFIKLGLFALGSKVGA